MEKLYYNGRPVELDEIEMVQLGNKSDTKGDYCGRLIRCKILQIEKVGMNTIILAQSVEKPELIISACYVPHMFEHNIKKYKPLYSGNNFRIIGSAAYETMDKAKRSLGFIS